MAPADPGDLVCVAQIGAAHGVRGEVRLRAFTDDPLAVMRYGPLQAENGRHLEIEAARPAKDVLVARFVGIADRDAAESLKNLKLYVPRARLPAIEEPETYYHADLVGLAVVDLAGTLLGTLTAIHDFGAGELIEVAPAAGGPTVLLPFTKTVVPTVDLAGRRVVVDPPADTLEAPEPKPDSRLRGNELT